MCSDVTRSIGQRVNTQQDRSNRCNQALLMQTSLILAERAGLSFRFADDPSIIVGRHSKTVEPQPLLPSVSAALSVQLEADTDRVYPS